MAVQPSVARSRTGNDSEAATNPVRRCKAHSKRTGLPCRRPPMRGQVVCERHGGRAPQNLAAAKRRLAETEIVAHLGVEVDTDPWALLTKAVRVAAGDLLHLQQRVAAPGADLVAV